MDQPSTPIAATTLDAVRLRRAELRESIASTERALADESPVLLHRALCLLADDVAAHIEVTEGVGGLHAAILDGDPRLAYAVGALTAEHHVLAASLAALLVDTEAPGARDVGERCSQLLDLLARHRQRGADLVHEAFNTDLGGGD